MGQDTFRFLLQNLQLTAEIGIVAKQKGQNCSDLSFLTFAKFWVFWVFWVVGEFWFDKFSLILFSTLSIFHRTPQISGSQKS